MDIYFQLLWENTKQLDCWIDSQQSFKGPISKVEYALRRGKICILPFFILEWQFSQMLLTTNGWESVSFPWFCLATAKIGNGGLVLQLSFIRQATDNTPWGMRISWPQRRPSTHFGSLFLYACLPLPEPAPCQVGLARRGRGFHLAGPTLQVWGGFFLCSLFTGFSLLWLLATATLDSFLLFWLLNKTK